MTSRNIAKDIYRDPISGLGKPEALKHELSGLWSRRITDEHHLVYSVTDEEIVIVSCKFHY
jgi:toxin YoeB